MVEVIMGVVVTSTIPWTEQHSSFGFMLLHLGSDYTEGQTYHRGFNTALHWAREQRTGS